MMQSVALTESSFRNSDEDFVVVEMPRVRPMHRTLGSIFDILATAPSTMEDNDDASYDYCDDISIHDTIAPPTSSIPLSVIDCEDVELSFVVQEDDVSDSEYPPSLSEDDNGFTTKPQELDSDNLSDLSTSIPDDSAEVKATMDAPTDPPAIPSSPPLDATFDPRTTDAPDDVNPPGMMTASTVASTIESKDSAKTSRLSNKKRRKQLKLAKKAAAAATALSKLSASSSSSRPKTRRSGKQVAPIELSRTASQ